ncbi:MULTISPECIES: hypothetical protein [unclassified Enterococcus]|uniref:hypothetical protein n=1 Tax=unclassified Enterococcus TaxID=2608891 RepID=UPI003F682AA1
MNNFDLWKWVASKRPYNGIYSKKNWLYVLLMLGLFIGMMMLYYLISVFWK